MQTAEARLAPSDFVTHCVTQLHCASSLWPYANAIAVLNACVLGGEGAVHAVCTHACSHACSRTQAHPHTHPPTHTHTHTHTHTPWHTHTEENMFRAMRAESELIAHPTLLMNLVPVIAQILEACFESTWICLGLRPPLGEASSGGEMQLRGDIYIRIQTYIHT